MARNKAERNLVTDPRHIKDVRKKQQTVDRIKLKKQARNEYIKDQVLNHGNIYLLMTEVLGYNKTQDFHMLMYYHNQRSYKKMDSQKWHLALAPRGGGKSTILTIGKIVMRVLQNPNIRILIASKTDGNASGFLTEIKECLLLPRLIEIFGHQYQKGCLWNETEIEVAGKTEKWKEPNIMTVGYTGTLASNHFDEIYCDDLVDEENSKTLIQREKLFTWLYKICIPTLFAGGEINFIGTRYHPEDLYGQLIETVFTRKGKKGKKKGKVIKKWYIRIPALLRKINWNKERRRLKREGVKIKKWHKYESFWPEMFSTKFLILSKKSQGSIIFNSQMMNDVEAMKGKIFKYDWFEYYDPNTLSLKGLHIYSGVDLAIKQSDDADKFAHCTVGVDPKTKEIYVLDYYNRVTHFSDQKRVIKRKFIKFDPIKVAIEANGYQRALLQDMKATKSMANVRAFPVFTDTDKHLRAAKLSAYFEAGQVFITRDMHELQEQLLGMPDSRYKDLFDALDIAINAALFGHRKKRTKEIKLLGKTG